MSEMRTTDVVRQDDVRTHARAMSRVGRAAAAGLVDQLGQCQSDMASASVDETETQTVRRSSRS